MGPGGRRLSRPPSRLLGLWHTASRFDLRCPAVVMPVVEGQDLAAPEDQAVISLKNPGFGGLLPHASEGKGLENA